MVCVKGPVKKKKKKTRKKSGVKGQLARSEAVQMASRFGGLKGKCH